MRKYMSIFKPSHEKLIEFIVKGNGAFWATLELELETEKKGYKQ